MSADGTTVEAALVHEAMTALLRDYGPAECTEQEFWGAQFDAGLAWVQFPRGRGGLGVDSSLQAVVNRRISAAGGSLRNRSRNIVGIGYAAATLVNYASEELQHRLLRPLFTAEEIWCQLFSEPGAGSDLAGLATVAVRDGDEWVVSGQKVWTSFAHVASWSILVARTDPGVPKHRGLTFFVVDMRSPGIDLRPLYEMTSDAEFNEVFLDDVRVPDTQRLGDVGDGWRVALAALANERVSAGTGAGASAPLVDQALRAWRRTGRHSEAERDVLMSLWCRSRTLELLTERAAQAGNPGAAAPDGTLIKLGWAETNKAASTFALNLLGADGMLYPDQYRFERPVETEVHTESVHKAFLRSRANSIEGGTTEIMKNILGERVLGLPPEQRSDRDLAWRDVPRN